MAERQGLLSKVEARLEQSALNVRAGELIFFSFGGAVVTGLLGIAVMGPLGILVGFGLGLLLPVSIVNLKAGRRLSRFNSQLPDMLQLMSSSLRAGYSVVQAVDAVAGEVQDPMGTELERVITEAQLGRPLNDALLECAQRMNSRDFEWAVLAINIQREVGGNLSELLDTVAETMIERERLRREVKALTAEGRVSAGVLVCMPVALGLVMYTINPDYTGVLFQETVGRVMLAVGVFAMVVGFFWMKKVITIKV
jgi:tight adherence protein B